MPESIKNKALRQLWMSDALYTTPDPFQDYLHDYTDAAVAVPPGTLKTAYRIGKGFLTDEEVAEWEKLGKPAEATKLRPAVAKPARARKRPLRPSSIGFRAPNLPSPPRPPISPRCTPCCASRTSITPRSIRPKATTWSTSRRFPSPNVRFLVARRDGIAVGCGALILGVDGEAELKRMFVAPEARGQKIGARMLEALEASAKAEGVRVIRLETGVRQPESLALYRRHGYTERGPFGTYQRDPLSTFFEKWIA